MLERFKVPITIASIIAITVSITVIWRGLAADHASFEADTHWVCDRGHPFSLTVRQVSDHHQNHYGQPIPCPVCNSTVTDRDRSQTIAGVPAPPAPR
jgi:hypothetical protein